MLISVAVCTAARYSALGACLDALAAQRLAQGDFEILVIDNGGAAAASRQAAKRYRGIANLVWRHADRPGLAHARNLALRACRAPLLAFIDDDALADPGWLAALFAGFAAFPGAAIAGGPVRPRWLAARPGWLADGLLGYLSVVDHGPEPRLLRPEEWVAGTNVAYRVAALRQAGGFDARLGRSGALLLSNEETELAWRLARAGGATAWLPAAAVAHCIGTERLAQGWFRRRAAWQAVSDAAEDIASGRGTPAASRAEAERFFDFTGGRNGLAALSEPCDDPAMFHWQVSAIYHLLRQALGTSPDGEPHGPG